MPRFEDSTESAAPPEEVWKILYDPARFPDWWTGIERVEREDGAIRDGTRYTYYPPGYPDFPISQVLETVQTNRRVVISCLVSDLRYEWQLEPLDDEASRISVAVEIPEAEAKRLEDTRSAIRDSLRRLAALAAAE